MARKRRRGRAIVGALVVLVLAGGAATVFALDYNQAKTNAKDTQVQVAKDRAAAGVELIGSVTARTATSMTVLLSSGKSRRLTFTIATRVQDAKKGTQSDVQKGMRALLHTKPGSPEVADEILVLPSTARIGQPIGKAGFGDVWLLGKTGQLGPKVDVRGARVDHAVGAQRAAVTVGSPVIVHAQTTVKPVRFIATEIVVLASDTALAG
jgi:hypothetical protein